MGVRFSCHGCAKPLNIKLDLAGRRGVCPECGLRFRIPKTDAEFSIPLEDVGNASAQQQAIGHQKSAAVGGSHADVSAEAAVAVAEKHSVPSGDFGSADGASSAVSTGNLVRSKPGVDPISQAIELIASDASATWYVRPPSGGQYGPANGEALKSWITEGRVAKTALLWRDGWPQWREASEALPEIADSLPGAAGDGDDGVFGEVLQAGNASLATGGDARNPQDSIDAINTQESVALRGTHDLGATRRKRSSRRTLMVAVLATVVIGLVVTLILVAAGNSSGGG